MKQRWTRVLGIAASIAIVVTLKFALAAEPDDKGPPAGPNAGPPAAGEESPGMQKYSGTVSQFNYTPRGERDGILLTSDGKLVQLVFPPHEAKKLADAVSVGDQISAEGMPEPARADHPICRLQKLTTAKGQEITIAGPPRPRGQGAERGAGKGPDQNQQPDGGGPNAGPDAGPGQGPAAGPGEGPGNGNERGPRGARRERNAGKTETLKGVVKSLNHGPRGEVDGAVLENGDFIRIGPREAQEAKLDVGQEISAEGVATKMPDGHMMIERPVKLNDKELARPQPPGRRGGPAERQPQGGDAPPPAEK